jgi:hypothetical protein
MDNISAAFRYKEMAVHRRTFPRGERGDIRPAEVFPALSDYVCLFVDHNRFCCFGMYPTIPHNVDAENFDASCVLPSVFQCATVCESLDVAGTISGRIVTGNFQDYCDS